ncbi:MAG: lytic transglycosylase F [Hyphomicrobiales bacterium]|nr:lytic transglycosylase F [Hyphomicrobiales bacterium]
MGSAPAHAETATMTLPRSTQWTGDLDVMLKRRLVRILVPFSKTQYFVDKDQSYGVAADLGRELQAELNKRYGKSKVFQIAVAFVPTQRGKLLDDLAAGRGDIAAGALTITPERAGQVDFADPWLTDVKEVLVTGPDAPPLSKLDDLAGKEIRVRKSSSYFTHLGALSEALVARGLAPIDIEPIADDLEDEDLMEMVNAGLLPYVVVDDFKAKIWATIFTKLTVREDLAVNTGGHIAWAIRKNSPQLRAELDRFVAANKFGTLFGNIMKQRYFTDNKILKTAYAPADAARFDALVAAFKRYGDQSSIDYRMLMAQGYQESQLDQSKRSPYGAVGVMQLLLSTGKEVGVAGIDKDAEANVHAGAAYMRRLQDAYVNDPNVDEKNRVLMTFAAYNAGPGNLQKFRLLAKQDGYDPNVWFGNVENEAAKVVGAETVQYVSNIYKYYIAYSLYLERKAAAEAARQKVNVQPPPGAEPPATKP